MAPLALSFLLGLSAACVWAAPMPLPKGSGSSGGSGGSGCTFSGADGAAKVEQSKSSCSTIVLSNLQVPAGKTLDLTRLKEGTQVTFKGTTTFGFQEWKGPLVAISGKSITVTGDSGSVLDGGGKRWWDGKGGNGGKTKPKFFKAHDLTSSKISGITIKNAPVQAFSINQVQDLTVEGVTFDNKDGDGEGGHNSDAFDVGSSKGVTISGAKVYNQDDCLAVNSGTDITFTGGYCSGGHGLSIGSVGKDHDNDVVNVTIENSEVVDSDNGIRIKTIAGGTGNVKGVTYSGIKLSGIKKNGIVIEQDYLNGSPTGKPTAGVPITGLTIKDVTGSVTGNARPIYVLCAEGACSGWKWSGVRVTGGKKSQCENAPSGVKC